VPELGLLGSQSFKGFGMISESLSNIARAFQYDFFLGARGESKATTNNQATGKHRSRHA
jgi:hypothetical protein